MRFDIYPPSGNTRGPVYTESIIRALHAKQGTVGLILRSGSKGVGLSVEIDASDATTLAELQDAYPGTDIKPAKDPPGDQRTRHSANLRLRPDVLLMRFTEFFQVLPALLFAMVLVTLFSPSLTMIAIAIGVVSWPQTARLTRAEFMKIKNLEYVTAARAIGAKNGRIMWRVILPNALPPLIVSATLTVGVAILFEAGLSFLGLGDPNTMSWGLMIGSNREYILQAWWPVTFPGVMIFLTVFAVSLIGDGLNDAFNPKLRER